MIKQTGHADLPLHTGTVPRWLSDRMMTLGTEIAEAIIVQYGKKEFLVRLSDPLWFQSFGAVLGMDWHSSGITTSVMYALKRGLNERSKELGVYICGGRGKYSRQTPEELLSLSDKTGLNGCALVRASRLCAKIDSSAVQDGFSLYQHNFIVTDEGDWAVVQQGMNIEAKTARRYHWSSAKLRCFVEEPHTAVTGENQGKILNLTAQDAASTRKSILDLSRTTPDKLLFEVQNVTQKNDGQLLLFDESEIGVSNGRNCTMPHCHQVKSSDVDLKRLGAVLVTAYENEPSDFESLLLTKGLGSRTLQSLTLVSEIINGTPSRFTDPARFSFAHGGKDGHPFPVPIRVYDESISILGRAIEKSKLGYNDKSDCINRLHKVALQIENNCAPLANFNETLANEMQHSKEWGGRTVKD